MRIYAAVLAISLTPSLVLAAPTDATRKLEDQYILTCQDTGGFFDIITKIKSTSQIRINTYGLCRADVWNTLIYQDVLDPTYIKDLDDRDFRMLAKENNKSLWNRGHQWKKIDEQSNVGAGVNTLLPSISGGSSTIYNKTLRGYSTIEPRN